MGLKTFDSDELLDEFIDSIKDDPTTEILPTSSEWEAFRYRREQLTMPDLRSTGLHEYGIVYRNKKGRLNFTGIAEADYRQWYGGSSE